MAESQVLDALQAWRAVLGTAQVSCDEVELNRASTGTFSTWQRVQAIVRPGDVREVQECVRIANRFSVPIYPISSGRNWGYGSRVPARDGVLLDLGRLDRIIEINEELAYVTLEPGVTQRQLYAALEARGSRLWMDATGASPDCSIIGNTMERGFGHTPLGDHCGSACGLQVVLPTGDLIDTGFSRFAGSTGPLSRWGVGPSLDGLFSQSNFGIVTRMSVWLMPKPEAFSAFFFMTRREDGLADVAEALRPLRLNGTLRSVVHVGNDYKVLAAGGADPEGLVPSPDRVVDREAIAAWRNRLGIGAWNGSGGLYGSRAQVRDAKAQVRRALRGRVDRLHFVDDRRLRWMERFAGPFKAATGWDLPKTLSVLKPVYSLLKGQPTDATLKSSYWRKSAMPESPDPDRDGCGLIWCSPVVPIVGPHLREVTGLAADTLLASGFEPQMSVSLATERSAICVITIGYDRTQPGADGRARECYDRLSASLLARGYPPYRLSVAAMESWREAESYERLLRGLKVAFDPQGILAPGRYEAAASAAPSQSRSRGVA